VQPSNQPWESAPVDKSSTKDSNIPSTPSARHFLPLVTLGNDNSEAASSGFATYQTYNNKPARTFSYKHNASSTSLGWMSTSESTMKWPLERVINWLIRKGFSKDWQETFKFLELEGADFLGLGQGGNGRGNLEKLHQQVYPQLAKECQKSGSGWNQHREHKEGKRMWQLIREIQDGNEASSQTHRRRESQTMIISASTEGGLENSPNLGWESTVPPRPASYIQHPAHRQTPNTGEKQTDQTRPGAAPFSYRQDAIYGDSRSEFTQHAVCSLETFRKQSPSSPSDGNPFKPPPSLTSRKSFGPEYDFEETKVDFDTPHIPQSSSDDDSDDGLFAKPLVTSKPQNTRSNKGRSVAFKSPNANDEQSIGPPYPSSAVFPNDPRSGFDGNGATFPSAGHLSEEEKPSRFATNV
jgi:mitogen-activated protein kinase kinase kinase